MIRSRTPSPPSSGTSGRLVKATAAKKSGGDAILLEPIPRLIVEDHGADIGKTIADDDCDAGGDDGSEDNGDGNVDAEE